MHGDPTRTAGFYHDRAPHLNDMTIAAANEAQLAPNNPTVLLVRSARPKTGKRKLHRAIQRWLERSRPAPTRQEPAGGPELTEPLR